VSTALQGAGNQRGSWQTPKGRHRIATLIGTGCAMNTAFVGRKVSGMYDPQHDDTHKDWILTRIIRLKGDQTGINRRGSCDTFQRYIYIHGTHDEPALGTPASHGCIRMANDDIMALYQRVRHNELVYIV
ncbi:MAG: L,D-transpeptidase, partial [Mariprofundaceae bacterium]|nr:L,D-transpeptidase [Mariprofundaceae bacterium]